MRKRLAPIKSLSDLASKMDDPRYADLAKAAVENLGSQHLLDSGAMRALRTILETEMDGNEKDLVAEINSLR